MANTTNVLYIFINFLLILIILFEFSAAARTKDLLLRDCLKNNEIPSHKYVSRDNTNTSDIYNHLNHQWNTRKGIIQPLGYFLPTEVADVQIIIYCGRQLNISMVGKGGGHSHEKYSFGDSTSVIIDLQLMDQIKINQGSMTTAEVGSGVLMGKLVWSLWQGQGQGRCYAVPTTDCPNAGIGGATLSGGFGVWSKRWGMLSDNVIEFEMVDANGDVLIANEVNNTDLYWALRGGGAGNFGIVTKFKYRLIDVTDVKVTFIELTYNFNDFSSVVTALLQWIQKTIDDPMHTYMSLEADGQVIIYVIDLDMDPLDIQAVKQWFPANTTNFRTERTNFIEYVAAEAYPPKTVEELANVTRNEYPQYSTRVQTYFSAQNLNATQLENLRQICSEIPKDVFLYIDAWGGELNRIERNATAFVHRNQLFMLHVSLRTDDPAAEEWMQRFHSVAANIINSTEGLQTLVDEKVENYLEYYYGQNLQRLVQIKRTFDPHNFFSFPQSIPINLPFLK